MPAGELVTETFAYDGGRAVTVYVPPTTPEVILYSGDGHLIPTWGESLVDAGVPSTMIVSAHATADPDEWARIKEYSPSFEPELFAAHERFLVDEVRAWVHERFDVALPRERTAMFGVSASGELALAIGHRHPDVFGAIFCASPGGGYQPPGEMQDSVPRTYLVGGSEEPFFLENAQRWADALERRGVDVVMAERAGDHGDPFWREELPRMITWAFGARSEV